MSRTDILLILSGAAGAIVLVMLLGFIRALYLRRRRKRQAAQAWRNTMPQPEHPAIAEIRKEADDWYKEHLRRREAEDRRKLEDDWRSEGSVTLVHRKKPNGETPR